MEQKPHLTVVIGGNGAGKTTWARSHKDLLPKKFFNADSLAEALGDANFPENQREARVMVDQKIQSSLHAGRSFGFESTYSGRSRPSVVREGGLCRKVPKPPVTPSALSCNLSVSQEDTGMAHKAPGKSFREGISLVQIFRMFPIPQPKRRPE